MNFKWPALFFKLPVMVKLVTLKLGIGKPATCKLSAIYITAAAGLPMLAVDSAEAIEARGLQGDRYYNKTGYWDPVEGCQVTLISTHDLQLAKHGNTLDFDHGSHRRNLVIDGIKTKTLQGKTFQLGEALFRYEKPRPPCGYLNKIAGRGMAYALSYNSGICIRVLSSGRVSVGDALIMIDVENIDAETQGR